MRGENEQQPVICSECGAALIAVTVCGSSRERQPAPYPELSKRKDVCLRQHGRRFFGVP